MPLTPGTRIGAYEVLDVLGAGGMGEVYRARDLNLGREVALKTLPASFSTDAQRRGRLNREAQLLAALTHPHIAAIYGLEEFDGTSVLALELVDGESIADRLRTGPIALDDALAMAREIAEALASAHEKGIVHRDLKPANVMLTADGQVKVLDFGLAKILETDPTPASVTVSPTLSVQATLAGTILGTAAYMSPEQARGRIVDKRTDIWAFGCVLFEMLAGRRAFDGDDVTDTIAAVVRGEPAWSALPPNLPLHIRRLLQRCLTKDPRQRVGDMAAVLYVLGDGATIVDAPAPTRPQAPLWRRALPIASAVVLTAAAAGTVMTLTRPAAPPAPIVTRFTITLPSDQQFTNPGRQLVSVSPDGTHLVYVANERLYLRPMGADARPIPGSETGGPISNPVFSPDGREIAYFQLGDQNVKRLAVTGGAAVTVAQARNPLGMTWDSDGLLLGQAGAGIVRISANGGTPQVVAAVDTNDLASSPQMLAGGHILFSIKGLAEVWDRARVVVKTSSGELKTLVTGGADGRYLSTGHLLYAVSGVVMAVPFDVTRLEVLGGPVPVIEGVRRASAGTGTGLPATAQWSVAANGSLVYVPGPAKLEVVEGSLDLAIFDGKGGMERLGLTPGTYRAPRVSPDAKSVAVESGGINDSNIWVHELGAGTASRRLTFGGNNRSPVWSHDGEWIAFQSDRDGDLAVFRQRADGTGTAERLTKPEQAIAHDPQSWSPDGAHLLISIRRDQQFSLAVLSLSDRTLTPYGDVRSVFPTEATISPDGRWVAYQAREQAVGGNTSVYLGSFPTPGAKYLIPQPGGHPSWSAKGDRVLINTGISSNASVGVRTAPRVGFTPPVPFSRVGRVEANPATSRRNVDALPDGRLLGVTSPAPPSENGAPADGITVVLNWFEELRARVPPP